MQELLDNNQKICFSMTLSFNLEFFGMKFARNEFESEAEPCDPEDTIGFKKFTFQKENIVIYVLQFGISAYFFLRGIVVFLSVVDLLKNILMWILGLSNNQTSFSIDFNTFRVLISNKAIIEKLSEQDLVQFNPVSLTFRFLRPLYYVCMFGYVLQMISGATNLYCLFYSIEITQTQLTLTGFAVFFAWIDLYTLTSLSKSSGILSTSIVSIAKHVYHLQSNSIAHILHSRRFTHSFCLRIFWTFNVPKDSPLW